MNERERDKTRAEVRERYAALARAEQPTSCCAPQSSCCGSPDAAATSAALGYSDEELASTPAGANLGLGCGNPQAIAALKPGEVVLDLGSGAGFDCFLAARQVGPEGRVIGVDMTPDMLSRARANAQLGGHRNIDFRLGEIEHLPVADGSIDVILSNCVINLSPDKPQVFHEALRVLKPGGRLAISDVVALGPLPEALKRDIEAYGACISGASQVGELQDMLHAAGFEQIEITIKRDSSAFIKDWIPGSGVEQLIASAELRAVRPTGS